LPSIAIDVRGVDAHARFIASILTGGDSRDEGGVLERAVLLIEEEKIRPGVIGDCDVGPSVVVEVSENDAHAFCFGLADSRSIAYVSEGTVVIVVIELDLLTFVIAGMTVRTISGTPLSTPRVVLRGPFDVIGHDQIEVPVLVVVEPSGTRGPSAFVCDTSL